MREDVVPGCAKAMNRDELAQLEAELVRGVPQSARVKRKVALAWTDAEMRAAERRVALGQPVMPDTRE